MPYLSKSSLNAVFCGLALLLGARQACANNQSLAEQTSPVPAADPGSPLSKDWHHGAFMEIFVRAYQDSNGDGVGDLKGITQRLDYLQALGIKGIWLMPINPSQDGDHGYSVSHYRDIEPAYGNLADFDELIKQAHARGIGVIIDYVINHSAANHPVFQASAASPNSAYRDWYVWENTAPKDWQIFGHNPWHGVGDGAYLAQFNINMPDFNFANPKVKQFHLDNMRFWLNRGVDGFRFDAVTHLVENGPKGWYDQAESYAVMGEFHKELSSQYSNRFYVCEATHNAEKYAAPEVCGRAFAFGHQYDVSYAARGNAKAIKKVATFFSSPRPALATMLSNHDLFAGERPWDQFKGNQAQYRLAAATYLLQPGTPFIYYGEEIGMSAHPELQGDPKLRVPMSWTADIDNSGFSKAKPFRGFAANSRQHNVELQVQQNDSLHGIYLDLLGLRNRYRSLSKGNYQHAFVQGKVMGFQREWQGERSLVLINYGLSEKTIKVKNLAAAIELKNALLEEGANLKVDDKGVAKILLAPQSVQVFVSL
jgi:alpha-amylase